MATERTNNFNTVAFIYDGLARLIFGKEIIDAQFFYFSHIAAHSRILIVGGGTGVILQALDKLELDLNVTYVEPSTAMIQRAKARGPFQYLKVNFIEARHDNLEEADIYDVIMTNFFLDLFREEDLRQVIHYLAHHLASDGIWLCTDFEATEKFWQQKLMQLMYSFFRWTARVEGRTLLDFNTYFEKSGFLVRAEEYFYSGMIKSSIFSRTGHV